MSPPKPSRVAVLLNQAAGTIVCGDGRSLGETIEAAFAKRGVAATLEFLPGTELKAHAERAMEQAKTNSIDAVVVGGGDGSIASVAGVLADTEIPLGILPLGTLNHFAKDLGIPLQVEQAADVIADGFVRSVDLGEVNGESFINNSSIGIYPYLVVDRERLREPAAVPAGEVGEDGYGCCHLRPNLKPTANAEAQRSAEDAEKTDSRYIMVA